MNDKQPKATLTPKKRLKRWGRVGLGVSLVLILLVSLFFSFFFHLRVASSSMVPTLAVDDVVVARRFKLEPQRGDIVAFKSPWSTTTLLLKRVIGLPGDRVVIANKEIIIYNQQAPEGFKLELAVETSLLPLPANEPVVDRLVKF